MTILPIPPPNPDEHLMHGKNRQREASSGRPGMHVKGLSTGDVIIFAVLAVAVLGGLWFLVSWLSP